MSIRAKHQVVAGVMTACCSLLAIGQAARAGAVFFDVDTTLDRLDLITGDGQCLTDQGTCSLRAAVMEANVLATDVEIRLPAGNFVLTRDPSGTNGADSGDLNLTPSAGSPTILIRGAGASFTIIDADQRDRVFTVHSGRAVSLNGLTIRGGVATAGGGIDNKGDLQVHHCVIRSNSAVGFGGGIYNELSGSLGVFDSRVSGNGASFGGGIASGNYSQVESTSIDANVARQGGGIFSSAELHLKGSTVSDNHAFGEPGYAYGGGIFNQQEVLYMTNSTISHNTADRSGGGMHNAGGTVWTYNVTIAFNEADADQDGDGVGGGVFNSSFGVVNLRNSVVAGNTLHAAPIYDDCRGAIGSYGRNKFSTIPAQCTVTQFLAGDFGLLGSLAELGPLRFNGGETRTQALVPPSDMIDGGEPIFGCVDISGSTLLLDQRSGYRSGAGVRCDIGAYEYGALPEGSLFSDDFETASLYLWL